jgi:hypothetical protein
MLSLKIPKQIFHSFEIIRGFCSQRQKNTAYSLDRQTEKLRGWGGGQGVGGRGWGWGGGIFSPQTVNVGSGMG